MDSMNSGHSRMKCARTVDPRARKLLMQTGVRESSAPRLEQLSVSIIKSTSALLCSALPPPSPSPPPQPPSPETSSSPKVVDVQRVGPSVEPCLQLSHPFINTSPLRAGIEDHHHPQRGYWVGGNGCSSDNELKVREMPRGVEPRRGLVRRIVKSNEDDDALSAGRHSDADMMVVVSHRTDDRRRAESRNLE
ncbi:hypothetical protein MPTK1_7g07520 [Marchantia polymorpha subsp. ruderalis]